MATQMLPQDANTIDLSRLNGAERRVLRMLAEGHTAKSVANAIGSTPAAVNERLREARRKTGIGSSRELARLLKSQENRDDQFGVVKGPASAATPTHSDAKHRRRRKGVLVMVGLTTILVAGAAALMSDGASTSNYIDPLLGDVLPKFANPADLHTKIRTESRDPEWAVRTENAIRARALEIPLVGKKGNTLRVLCARTVCEISGTLIVPSTQAEREDQNSQFNRTIKDLQAPPLSDDLGKLRLRREAGMFTGGKGEPERSVFMLYYSREK